MFFIETLKLILRDKYVLILAIENKRHHKIIAYPSKEKRIQRTPTSVLFPIIKN